MRITHLIAGFWIGVIGFGLVATGPIMAPPVANAGSGFSNGFADLSARLQPAVVGIRAKRLIPGAPRDQIHANAAGSSTGSGFVIDPRGVVVTNNHVIEGNDQFEIILVDGTTLAANLVGRDSETDLAVLRVVGTQRLASVAWGNSDTARVGDWAIAIGSPFGLGNSLSVGVISARNRDLQAGRYDDFLQTDAAINRGNSGGPLFNARGEVIGVNTAIVSPGGTQGGSVGVGFAVPSNLARQVVADILANGSVQRGWIGVRARLLSAAEGGNGQNGVVVADVAPNSPAARAGLRLGDRIQSWNGQPVTDPRALARFVAGTKAGTRVRLQGFRGRQAIFANLVVGQPPAEARPPRGVASPTVTALGLVLRAAAPADRSKLPANVRVVISALDPFGPGKDQIRPGDGLIEVQGRAVTSPQDARAALEAAARKRDAVVVRLYRDGQSIYRALRPTR
ncbi:periplasmic serine endoprotease DegP [Candidatus Phycosocius bacilliformis]|uniref:Periplasmic serine endoprotease DegP n=1 Tax=Candidatus Phycosocius bacilliformis TaxID=1445552 RepID=A0A2P2EC95_9PROT|nr:trypsin-like peptidase domain-containing protein [Candidatus Phycosocius bacilliformis]GBF58700.1 periplasmic serine endoprotease DegP [Candidatus Phycosocius bacilliformis]